MRNGDNISDVAALGVDWIGMIFWSKSPRCVKMIPTHAGTIPDRGSVNTTDAKHETKLVGVFVDDTSQNIITRLVNYGLDIIQLHGNETPTQIKNLRATIVPDIKPDIKIIKAISVEKPEDIEHYRRYEDCVDYFLFDTKCNSVGGSGEQFDWSVLDRYHGDTPFLLSGGIGPDDAQRIKDFYHPKMIGIDINSQFETQPAMKDVSLISTFISQLANE